MTFRINKNSSLLNVFGCASGYGKSEPNNNDV